MSRLRSLRFKIAFVFFLVTAAAFTVIWFGVVPQLEQNLRERRLDDLQEEARAFRPALELPPVGGRQPAPRQFADRVSAAEDATDARLDGPATGSASRPRTATRASTRSTIASRSRCRSTNGLARRAALTKHIQRAYGSFHDEDIGMVAQPHQEPGPARPRRVLLARLRGRADDRGLRAQPRADRDGAARS